MLFFERIFYVGCKKKFLEVHKFFYCTMKKIGSVLPLIFSKLPFAGIKEVAVILVVRRRKWKKKLK